MRRTAPKMATFVLNSFFRIKYVAAIPVEMKKTKGKFAQNIACSGTSPAQLTCLPMPTVWGNPVTALYVVAAAPVSHILKTPGCPL